MSTRGGSPFCQLVHNYETKKLPIFLSEVVILHILELRTCSSSSIFRNHIGQNLVSKYIVPRMVSTYRDHALRVVNHNLNHSTVLLRIDAALE